MMTIIYTMRMTVMMMGMMKIVVKLHGPPDRVPKTIYTLTWMPL